MAIVGYRRVSSSDQNLDRQDLGNCDKVFEDKLSGKDRSRPGLEAALSYCREGDTLRVYSADRMSRSLKDLLAILDELTSRDVVVELLSEGMTFNPQANDPYQRAMLQVMGTFAELERNLIRARQQEGIALAKDRGDVYRGRAAALAPEEVKHARQRRRDGVTLARLMRDYGVSKPTMQNAIAGRGVYSGSLYC